MTARCGSSPMSPIRSLSRPLSTTPPTRTFHRFASTGGAEALPTTISSPLPEPSRLTFTSLPHQGERFRNRRQIGERQATPASRLRPSLKQEKWPGPQPQPQFRYSARSLNIVVKKTILPRRPPATGTVASESWPDIGPVVPRRQAPAVAFLLRCVDDQSSVLEDVTSSLDPNWPKPYAILRVVAR